MRQKHIFFCFFLFLFGFQVLQAQDKFTVSGMIRDKATGEELIGAAVYVAELSGVGTTANEYGFYSMTLKAGTYTIKSSYVGYQDFTQTLVLDKNTKLNIELIDGMQLSEVIVTADREDENIRGAQMGVEKLDVKEISKIPILFGEKDILKTIQLLPGVKSAGEGNSGFFVRGGTADQNLILLDEAPVYNASHLLGFFSTFNSDAIKDVTLFKGNSPAQYGGRLSSVLDIKMNEGNDNQYKVKGGIGLISSRLSVEGPLQKDRSSFLITGRRTYADVFLLATPDLKDNSLYFYDVNAKANYRINDNNRIFLSGYFGRDVLSFGNQFGIDWGNTTGTLRWSSLISPRLFSNTSVIYSKYNYNIKISGNGSQFNINSQIEDWNLKQEFQFFPNPRNSWRFGVNSIYHTLRPSRFAGGNDSIRISQDKETRYGWENAAYISNSFNATQDFNIDYGVRLSTYTMIGAGTYNLYENNIKTGDITLKSGEFGKTYFNIEPRLSMSYTFGNRSLKASYSRNTQNLHLLSNSTSTSPTDQWVGSSYQIKPEISDQVGIGYFQNFANNTYEMSVETYYKTMQNQVDYKNGADINTVPDVESELLFGKGRAYGLEVFLKKRTGLFTGWISYTLSRTERQIAGINNGNWYVARQDRTHEISLVGMYQISPKWNFSALWVYYTGNAVTFPSGKYQIQGQTAYYYTERNGYRLPDYHRLDISFTYESKRTGRYQSSWNIGIYNAYGRENAFTITFEDDPNDASRTRAIQTSLFRWVPSVTYNFSW